MDHTLVEFARVMLMESLWEPTVAHADYVRNRVYTTSIRGQTPCQGWYGTKPNVSHPYVSSSKGRIWPEKSCPSLNDTLMSDTAVTMGANQYILQRHFGVFKANY